MAVQGDKNWQNKAACRGMDPDLFMPLRGENLKVKKAKSICKECSVIGECRQYGLALAIKYDTHGIFGGLTRYERAAILKQEGRRMATGGNVKLVNISW